MKKMKNLFILLMLAPMLAMAQGLNEQGASLDALLPQG